MLKCLDIQCSNHVESNIFTDTVLFILLDQKLEVAIESMRGLSFSYKTS